MGKLDHGIAGEQVEFPKGVLYINPFAVNLCLFAPAANGQQAFGGTLILVRQDAVVWRVVRSCNDTQLCKALHDWRIAPGTHDIYPQTCDHIVCTYMNSNIIRQKV
jgi:hypothetical protein